MFFRQTLRHIFIAGLIAMGLMSALFEAGSFLPPSIWIAALYPGMLVAEGLFSILPATAIDLLVGDADDAPVMFASMSVVLAFLFWWLCALLMVKLRAFWLSRRMLA